MAERERVQLVISLGEGRFGEKRRKALDDMAARHRTTVSAWARYVLLAAAGFEEEGMVTRQEFNALSIRVRRLETLEGLDDE